MTSTEYREAFDKINDTLLRAAIEYGESEYARIQRMKPDSLERKAAEEAYRKGPMQRLHAARECRRLFVALHDELILKEQEIEKLKSQQ